MFETDRKKFYREIRKETTLVEAIPSEEKVWEFWNNIWGKDK